MNIDEPNDRQTDWAERIYDKHDENNNTVPFYENNNTVPFSSSDIADVIAEVEQCTKEACFKVYQDFMEKDYEFWTDADLKAAMLEGGVK